MNHCFIVCDLKPGFADKMAEFVNKKRLAPYIMESFTNVNLLMDYGSKRHIDVLLIDEELYTEDIEKLNIEKVFLLVDDRQKLQAEGMTRLYKFSSIPSIMNAVMCDYVNRNRNAMSNTAEGKVKIIGAFTPLAYPGHSLFLLTLALSLAKKRKVCYLNLKSTYGLRKMLNKMSEPDLSDVMFLIKNGHLDIEEWPQNLINHYENMDFVLPPVSICDLRCAEAEDWTALLEVLKSASYEYILLDVDESTSACYELLKACDMIYCCGKDCFADKLAFDEFSDAMYKLGYYELIEKIEKINPPEFVFSEECSDYFMNLEKGEMGKYVESLFKV